MSVSVLPVRMTGGLQELPVAHLLRLLRRDLWLIVLCAAAVAIGSWLYTRSLPRYFTSEAAITVEGDTFAIPELRGALRTESSSEPMPLVRSEVQALYGRDLVEQAIDQLGLAKMAEFNPTLRPPSFLGTLRDVLGHLVPTPARDGDEAASRQAAKWAEADLVFGSVVHNLIVFNDNRSLVIRVSFTAEQPEVASGFVNALVRDYIAKRGRNRSATNQEASVALNQQVDQVHKEINGLEQQVRELRDSSSLLGLPNGSASQQQLSDLATATVRSGIEAAQIDATWQRAVALQKQGISDELAGVLGSTTISQLRSQEAQAARKLADLATRYGPSYPSVTSARADYTAAHQQLEAEVKRIIASLGVQASVARQHEGDARRQMEEARNLSIRGANEQARIDELQQEIKGRRTLYQTLLDRLQQTTTQGSAGLTPDIRVMSYATTPGFPAGPNSRRAGLLGGVAGALLGCLLTLTRWNSTGIFPNAASVTASIGLDVLTVLPRRTPRDRDTMARRIAANPSGSDAEALRLLRTRLRLSTQSAAPRSVVFVSSRPGEGSAPIAAAFARLAALDGERVLMIEGDLGSPTLARLLNTSDKGTLIPVLEARHRWREALMHDDSSSLDLLLAGPQGTTSHALLGGTQLSNLLMDAREYYTLIVLSAPPAATAADALALAHQADATVLVIDGQLATRSSVDEAASRLAASAQHMAGAVLIPA